MPVAKICQPIKTSRLLMCYHDNSLVDKDEGKLGTLVMHAGAHLPHARCEVKAADVARQLLRGEHEAGTRAAVDPTRHKDHVVTADAYSCTIQNN